MLPPHGGTRRSARFRAWTGGAPAWGPEWQTGSVNRGTGAHKLSNIGLDLKKGSIEDWKGEVGTASA